MLNFDRHVSLWGGGEFGRGEERRRDDVLVSPRYLFLR
jgi:hypothetical protein